MLPGWRTDGGTGVTRRFLSLGVPAAVRDRAIHLPHAWPTRRRWLASARTDVLVFSAATAVLALHVSVDSFIAPEPGTAPSDHVLRGAAAFTVLTIAAAVYPRLPAGGRAALATVLGALALEGAALAVADARAVGPRGEDWTGSSSARSASCSSGAQHFSSGARASRAGSATSDEPASRPQRRWRRTGSLSRSRPQSLPPTARVRMSRPPTSDERTRR